MYAGEEVGEDEEVRRVRIEEREGRRGGVDEPFLRQFLLSLGWVTCTSFYPDESGRGGK